MSVTVLNKDLTLQDTAMFQSHCTLGSVTSQGFGDLKPSCGHEGAGSEEEPEQFSRGRSERSRRGKQTASRDDRETSSAGPLHHLRRRSHGNETLLLKMKPLKTNENNVVLMPSQ